MFQEEVFDLIMMDINLPLLDGYTAASSIRVTDTTRTPIIAMTAHALSDAKEKCINAGMDDFISKPININELIQRVTFWLNK